MTDSGLPARGASTAAVPLPIPPDLPAPPGATHYLEQFSDPDGRAVPEPVAGGFVALMFYTESGDLLATAHGSIGS